MQTISTHAELSCVDLGFMALRRASTSPTTWCVRPYAPADCLGIARATVSGGRRCPFRMFPFHSRHVFVPTVIRIDQQARTQAHAEAFSRSSTVAPNGQCLTSRACSQDFRAARCGLSEQDEKI